MFSYGDVGQQVPRSAFHHRGGRAGPRRVNCVNSSPKAGKRLSHFKGHRAGEFSLSERTVSFFVLLRPWADWVRPRLGQATCWKQNASSNVTLIQTRPESYWRGVQAPPGLGKLTCKCHGPCWSGVRSPARWPVVWAGSLSWPSSLRWWTVASHWLT